MINNSLVDNDVIIKLSCFDLTSPFLRGFGPEKMLVLGATPFVVRKRLSKHKTLRDHARAMEAFEAFILKATAVEPTDEEMRLSARLEDWAKRNNKPLDSGESQLLAILVCRAVQRLFTGDKRAIQVMEAALRETAIQHDVCGRVWCLEQILKYFVTTHGFDSLVAAVCAEPGVDTVISICFRCASENCSPEDALQSLDSYIRYLRENSGRILATESF